MGSSGTPGAGRLWGQRESWVSCLGAKASECHESQSGAGHCGQGISSDSWLPGKKPRLLRLVLCGEEMF